MATAPASTPPQSPWRHLPNHLTASRFVLSALLFVLIAFEAWWGCLLVFVAASLTDWLDGFLARRYKWGSDLGRNLDPLADKVLTCGAFIFLLPKGIEGGWLVPWMVTVVVIRELAITGLRSYLEGLGAKFGADWLGKTKMVLQCAALIAIFVGLLIASDWPLAWLLYAARDFFIWAMVAATILSGLQYLWKAVARLKADNP